MGNKNNRSISRKKKFKGNRFTNKCNSKQNEPANVLPTASEKKITQILKPNLENEIDKNQIINLTILNGVFQCLCCPVCLNSGLNLVQESVFGLASNMSVKCAICDYENVFCTSEKVDKLHTINVSFVLGLRLLGKGHSGGKKLCSSVNLNCPSQTAFRNLEKKLANVAEDIASTTMNEAANEVLMKNEVEEVECGVSVDGTWQRRGHTSLNGCVSIISIDSGKVLDVEVLSKVCRICKSVSKEHKCSKHTGSSGAMEVVGVYRMFERSLQTRKLKYVKFYGDGDSKGYDGVKDMYGENSVEKLECIGHIQKRVGSRLRKLKAREKGLGGRGKLTDVFIDKLQNYYGIAIRSNVNNLSGMQSAVIAVFFHCCSNAKQPMHGQCPVGNMSWCKFQRAAVSGKEYKDTSKGLPKSIMNKIKPTYMKLCDQALLEKCLHGQTQNSNESFNGVLWNLIPKNTFVELTTLKFGTYLSVIQFNKGFNGLLDIFSTLGIKPSPLIVKGFSEIDQERLRASRRQSLPSVKMARKKNKLAKKGKTLKIEKEEGVMYKCGEF